MEQLCLALNDEFRSYLPDILPCCIQVLNDAERCNDYSHVHDVLHTLEIFGGMGPRVLLAHRDLLIFNIFSFYGFLLGQKALM